MHCELGLKGLDREDGFSDVVVVFVLVELMFEEMVCEEWIHNGKGEGVYMSFFEGVSARLRKQR